ncbi:MAG: hypothetical protein JXA17_06760 [Dehalococcoidales bacterium]|nr:hypothetical protein [Dehalococcoidales bacterium]
MNIFTRRMLICIVTGAILGVVCIVGAQIRSGFTNEAYYLFSFWFNRLLMGIVIGLAWGRLNTLQAIGRGVLLGLLVSFAFYSSTGFKDVIGFIMGVVYGVIIEYVALKLGEKAK